MKFKHLYTCKRFKEARKTILVINLGVEKKLQRRVFYELLLRRYRFEMTISNQFFLVSCIMS